MFEIQYTNEFDNIMTLPLEPAPTEVDYPDKRITTVKTTQDGNVVIQRPMRDPRPRRWVWRNYTPRVEEYETQWAKLEEMDVRFRTLGGMEPTVGIWEDESGTGGFERYDEITGEKQYTTARVIQVTRRPRPGGGPVVYSESVFEFIIHDPSYTEF